MKMKLSVLLALLLAAAFLIADQAQAIPAAEKEAVIKAALDSGDSMGFSGQEPSIRKELDILKPLLGKTWVGEEKHPNGQSVLHFMMSFELMHNGKTVKRYLECKELNFQSDGYFYYDPDRKEIALLQLGSNGNFSVGNVKAENGTILQYGYSISPNGKLEYKNPLEMTADGKLIDKFFSFEKGEWRAGHSRVYTAK